MATNTRQPRLTATGNRVGDTLSVDKGDWTIPDGYYAEYSYQWLRCNAQGGGCEEIPGATSSTYKLTSADVGYTQKARVSAVQKQNPPTPPPPPPGTPGILRDKPPGYPDYVGYTRITHDGRGYYDLDDSKDYLFVGGLGQFNYTEGVAINGGRNVVIIGGHVTATGSDRAEGVAVAVRGRTSQSHYYMEGLYLKPDKVNGVFKRHMNDGFATRGAVGKVTIQNCRVGPVAVKEGFTSSQAHADVLQVQAGPWEGELRVHRLTGLTDYTAVMYSDILVRKSNWHQVNMIGVDIDPTNQSWTVFYAGNPTSVAGLTMTEFYATGFANYGLVPTSLPIIKSAPPGGDFVPESAVAYPYTSPGYA